MELHEELNKHNVFAEVNEGVVTLLRYDEEAVAKDGGNYHGHEPEEFACEGRGFLDEHPEGEDRGGYVVWWKRGQERAYLYDGEWFS